MITHLNGLFGGTQLVFIPTDSVLWLFSQEISHNHFASERIQRQFCIKQVEVVSNL